MSYFWTTAEIRVLKEHYEAGGPSACLPLLNNRTRGSVWFQARRLGLSAPKEHRRGPRHTSTEWIDAQIRKLYQGHMRKGDVSKLAHRLGQRRDWVSRRAIQLGLVSPRLQEPRWCAEELEILDRSSALDVRTAQRRLRQAGYRRTPAAIVVKRKRLGMFRPGREDHTAHGLAVFMGVDHKTVRRWIARGMLKARRAPAGEVDAWLIRDADVREMLIDYTAQIDTRKIDKWYLVGVLTGSDRAKGNVTREAG